MPWFESSKDKEFRQLVQGKMLICITKPQKYQSALPVLQSLVSKPNQKAIEMIVDHIKQVIKDDDVPPAQKLQAIKLLRDLMKSQSKSLGKYVVKKILKRLTILAQHRKSQKNEERGANIFKCKKSQQKYGIEFLRVLLLSLQQWGQNWPRHADGPFHDFQSTYNDLVLQQVYFPPDLKKANKSPVPKAGFRNTRAQQTNSPPKMSLQNRQNFQNSISKPTLKQKKPLTQAGLNYIKGMLQMLNLILIILKQNPQLVGEIWDIIMDYIAALKTIDQSGNLVASEMIQNGNKNQELLNAIQNNSKFYAEIDKDSKIVKTKKQDYVKFHKKYITICQRMIISLSVFIDKPSSSSLANNNNNNGSLATLRPVQVQTSINQKVEEGRSKDKPLVQQGKNKYGSSQQLRKQLQLNFQPRKQDFNSGNLNKFNQNSESSSRYNSTTGQNQKNRNSISQFNPAARQTKERQVGQQQQQKNEQRKVEKKSKLDQFQKRAQFKQTQKQKQKFQSKKQISKITQKNENENQSENTFNKFDFQNPTGNQNQNVNGSFGDFEIPVQKGERQDSNSQFFKQIQNKEDNMKQTGMRRNKKTVGKNEQTKNFFDTSVKSKVESSLSGFQKSKPKQNSSSNQISGQNLKENRKQNKIENDELQNQKGFDTFKSPHELSKAVQQMKKSIGSQKSQVSNPFQQKNTLQRNKDFFGENSFNKSLKQAQNPFVTKQIPELPGSNKQLQNPFQTQFQNPFETIAPNQRNIYRQQYDNKSKSSNPFSEKSNEKNSVNSRPPIPKKKSGLSNPFDTISHPSQKQGKNQNPFEKQTQKQDNPFGTSFLSNPFEKEEQKKGNSSNQKSLSQRGSFVNAKNTQGDVIKNKSSVIDDPFQNEPKKKKTSPDYSLQRKQEKSKEQNSKNRVSTEQKNTNQVREKSFEGFGFQDFMNVNQQRSSTGSVNKEKNKSQKEKSQFGFSDFGNVQNQHSNRNSLNSNFFEQVNKVNQNKAIDKKQSKESSFDFFRSNNIKKEVPQKDNFFNCNNFDKKDDSKQNKKQQVSKNSFSGLQFGFDDFGNASNSNQNKQQNQKSSSLNPFSQFQKSKQSDRLNLKNLQPIKQKIDSKKSLNETDEWNKFGNQIQKQKSNSSDQWRKFDNLNQRKNSKNDQSPFKEAKSEYEQSEGSSKKKSNQKQKQAKIWFDQIDKKNDLNTNFQKLNEEEFGSKEPHFGNQQQKSISIQFEEPSPFQKKEIPWNYTLAALPSSTRYNISSEHVAHKKQLLRKIEADHFIHLQKYRQMNQILTKLKMKHSQCLQKLGETRQQKRQFNLILKRLQQTNQIKSKQIEQLIKKKKKAEQIKRKILENERLLYQKMKNDKKSSQSNVAYRQKVGNKFQRFNNNLQKQRQMIQMEKSVSHFSYYA